MPERRPYPEDLPTKRLLHKKGIYLTTLCYAELFQIGPNPGTLFAVRITALNDRFFNGDLTHNAFSLEPGISLWFYSSLSDASYVFEQAIKGWGVIEESEEEDSDT